jgi:hypothetical protein
VAQAESDSLALLEDQSLLGLTAGAFNPRFDPLSSSEQKTLTASEAQKPELLGMAAAGDSGSDVGRGLGAVVFIVLLYLLAIPF